ncbi:YeeE/YedE family protein [Pseudonocardia eucalypti]|uniref:YeeE/YedE family protein n=1 Tax=Pseudonocardia eucalypti TaxID=648755 RepID=A0ABP9R2D3_9PSEU|nr:putative membrane protein YedE/YeeE [Pseudonocardia eucalypti]
MSVLSEGGFLRRLPLVERAAHHPAERESPPTNWPVVAVGLVLAAALALAVAANSNGIMVITSVLGLALGFTLFHSRFGFTSAWRQLVSVGQGVALRAHMLMLAVACVLFAVVLATGVGLNGAPKGFVNPVGITLLVGAFLFGMGMQVGGSCASGTLFAVGSGQSAIVLTLFGFIAGSVIAAAHYTFWFVTVPSGPAVSLAGLLGYPGALLVSLAVMTLIVAASYRVAKRRNPPPMADPPVARGWVRLLRGSWPLWVGALLLGGLNAAVLFVSGAPWGVTSAFGLWGAKLLGLVGWDTSHWAFWQVPANAKALAGSVFADRISVLDFGIMVGALIASAAGGAFVLHRRVPWRLALGSVLGGIAMGYGARLAGGCNIGAYFSGIASFSLHGWVWGVAALVGTFAGLRLRPLFGLTNPKPADSIC